MADSALPQIAPAPRTAPDWLAALRGVIAAPGATFATLADAQPWRQGLTLYLLATVGAALVALVRPVSSGVGGAAVAVTATLVGGPLGLLLSGGVLYQVGLRQGGDGPFARLFAAQAHGAAAVGLVGLPLQLALATRAGAGSAALAIPVDVALGLWSLALTVMAVRASLRLSTGGAVATMLLSGLVAIVGGFLAICVLGVLVGLMR